MINIRPARGLFCLFAIFLVVWCIFSASVKPTLDDRRKKAETIRDEYVFTKGFFAGADCILDFESVKRTNGSVSPEDVRRYFESQWRKLTNSSGYSMSTQ